MISDHFDARTRINMETALDRLCRGRPDGESHGFRRQLAERIIGSAMSGRTSVGHFVEAAERAVIQMRTEKQSA